MCVSVQVSDNGAAGGSGENGSLQRGSGGWRGAGHRQEEEED